MGIFDRLGRVHSILDIGAGFGKYGVLLRDHLDIRKKRYHRKTWQHRIDAIEIWPDYINPIHQHVYNCIFANDAMATLRLIEGYDVIFLIEVLEHMPKERGIRLIEMITQKCNKAAVISFPQTFTEGACSDWPNPHEEHRCLWTFEELKAIAPNAEQVTKTVSYIIK